MQWKLLCILRRCVCGAWCLVQMSCLGKLWNCSKSFDKKAEHLRVLFKCSRVYLDISASSCGSAEIHLWSDARKCDSRFCKLKLRHEDSTRLSWDAERNLNRHPWPLVTFLCKSLVFGFAEPDSFRYLDRDNVYDPEIKFISEYLTPMVIHCKRLD